MFRKDFNLLHASSETTCHLFEYIVIKREPSFYILYHVLLVGERKCSLRPAKLAAVSFAKYQNRSIQE